MTISFLFQIDYLRALREASRPKYVSTIARVNALTLLPWDEYLRLLYWVRLEFFSYSSLIYSWQASQHHWPTETMNIFCVSMRWLEHSPPICADLLLFLAGNYFDLLLGKTCHPKYSQAHTTISLCLLPKFCDAWWYNTPYLDY